MKKLTVLSLGGGQDSTVLFKKAIHDQEFKDRYIGDHFVVVMADTGNEHPETYDHVRELEAEAERYGIPFFFLTLDKGYVADSWSGGLIGFYESKNAVGSKAFPKVCTDKLKISPIYKWLEEYVHETFGTSVVGRKRAIKEFVQENGQIDVMIGIAKGEESRVSTPALENKTWMDHCINKIYPLIDLNMDRQACQDYLSKDLGEKIPLPSNCILCPFMSPRELLYLHYSMPEWFDKWVDLERAKMEANAVDGDINKAMNSKGEIVTNVTVWADKHNKTLTEILEDAKDEFGHMTVEDLREYKMSHGHCVKSKY